MNWFGMFTCASIVLAVVGRIVYEYGYEKAIKDMSMSRNWVRRNHPSNERVS